MSVRTSLWTLCLTLLAAAPPAPADGLRTVEPPVRARLTVGDAGTLTGAVRAWDELELMLDTTPADDSDPARSIYWTELDASQAYALRAKLIDRASAGDWLALGALMLDLDDERRAQQALRRAERLDDDAGATGARMLELHAAGGDPRDALAPPTGEGRRDGHEAGGSTPEGPDTAGAQRGARPWPPLTDAERRAAVVSVKAMCDTLIDRAGLDRIALDETENFLLYSDLSSPERRKWAGVLDNMYRVLLRTLEIEPGTKLFNGKCPIFIFNTRDTFLRFEQDAMGFNAARAGGVCHFRGPNAIVVFYKGADEARFQSVLIHETVHAFFYRYRTPRQLPTWFNEGIADYVAGYLTPASNEPAQHWNHVKRFVLRGGDPLTIMAQSYADGTWFTRDSYPVSHMLTRFMLRHEPRKTKRWIDAIKGGADWKPALEEHLGVDDETLAHGFVEEMKSERTFSRLD